jgi:hypothetical protein
MIISASRRTDIPALYARWFRRRLEAGYCLVPNPMRPTQVSRVSLARRDVDAIVFWTRHARPLFDVLPLLERRGDRYYILYTITGYGRPVEMRTPPRAVAIDTFRETARRLPPGAVVWRYDPVLLGPAFPEDWHRRNFEHLATALEGATRRVIVSFVDVYRKTRRRMAEILAWGDELSETPEAEPGAARLLEAFAGSARRHGMEIEACAEAADYTALGVGRTRCIDDRLLGELFGGDWPRRKDPGQRPHCGCIVSRDIGIPDTCTLGCRYCYATRSDGAAAARRATHDPAGEALLPL